MDALATIDPSPTATPAPAAPVWRTRDRSNADHLGRLRARVRELTARCDAALSSVAADGGLDRTTHLRELRRVLLRGERRPTTTRRAQLELALGMLTTPDREVAADLLPTLVTDLHRIDRALARVAAIGHARTA